MQEYVIELSKYFIAFFMVLYTASCFYTFRYPVGEKHRGVFILQDLLMFLVQVLCFLNLSLVSGDFQYLFFFAFILIFLFATITMVSLIYENINRLLLNNMCMLLGIGLCIVSRLSFDKAIRQYVIVLVSLIFSLLVPYLLGKIHFFKKITWLYATLGIALLSTVLILGEVTHGSKISFSLGGITFQPSEFVKVAFILAGAETMDRLFARRNLIFTILFSLFCVGCLALMSDFGTALIFFCAFLVIAYLRSGSMGTVALAVTALIFAGVLALKIAPHALRRFSVWRHVWDDPLNAGYQQVQALMCVASGGLFGLGPGQGFLKHVFAADSDIAFATISEEWGLIVAVMMVLCVAAYGFFAIRTARVARSSFYSIGSCTAASILVIQTILNCLGTLDILPFTGVTFPFLSNGGTSMIGAWGLLAFVKAADTRQNASFAVRLNKKGA